GVVMVADDPCIFFQLVVQLPGAPSRITQKKLDFGWVDVSVLNQHPQTFKVTAPIDTVAQPDTAIELIVTLMDEVDAILGHRATQKYRETVGIGKLAHHVAEFYRGGLVEYVAHRTVLIVMLA